MRLPWVQWVRADQPVELKVKHRNFRLIWVEPREASPADAFPEQLVQLQQFVGDGKWPGESGRSGEEMVGDLWENPFDHRDDPYRPSRPTGTEVAVVFELDKPTKLERIDIRMRHVGVRGPDTREPIQLKLVGVDESGLPTDREIIDARSFTWQWVDTNWHNARYDLKRSRLFPTGRYAAVWFKWPEDQGEYYHALIPTFPVKDDGAYLVTRILPSGAWRPPPAVSSVRPLRNHEQCHSMTTEIMEEAMTAMWLERRTGAEVPDSEWKEYLRESFAENKPWIQLVSEILVSEPSEDEKPQPQTKLFLISGRPDIHQKTQDIARMFLGRDILCSQCHDHPTISDYLQEDYFGLFSYLQDAPEKAHSQFESVFSPGKKTTEPKLPGGNEVVIPEFEEGQEDLAKKYLLHTLRPKHASDGPIKGLVFLSDGSIAGHAEHLNGESSLEFWKPDQPKSFHMITRQSGFCLNLHPDGLQLAAATFKPGGRIGNGRHSDPKDYRSHDGEITLFNLFENPA